VSIYTILFTSSGGGLSAELRRRILNQSRYDIKIIAVDAKKSGQAEIFSDKFELVPNGIEEDYPIKIAKIIKQNNVNLVIPCSDEEALNLVKNKKIIEGKNCKLACTEYDTLKLISNKLHTYRYMKEKKIPVPIFKEANSINDLKKISKEMLEIFEEIVIKPASGRGGRNVEFVSLKANDKSVSLESFLNSQIRQYKNIFPVIVMEKFEGPIYDIDVLSKDGRLIRSLVRRRLNPLIPNEGHVLEKHDELYSMAEKLVKAFNLSWLYDCDFMLDNQGKPQLLEINPRPSGSLAVSLAAGINFIDDMVALEKKDELDDAKAPFGKIIYPFSSLC